MTLPLYTIGHSTHPIDEFINLLTQVDVKWLVDVRSIPRSRAMPQFNADVMPISLANAGIEYHHLTALGGRRHHRKGAPPSANTYWRVAAFRDYADYAETPEFRAGLDMLLEWSAERPCAIMCAEAVWWRCHRRIITDYALSRGRVVHHIMGAGNVSEATLTPGAQILADGTIRYVADTPPIPSGD